MQFGSLQNWPGPDITECLVLPGQQLLEKSVHQSPIKRHLPKKERLKRDTDEFSLKRRLLLFFFRKVLSPEYASGKR